MVMNDLNKDFMEKVLDDAVWKKMSKELSWNETLMEKYKDKINWMEISENGNILWTSSMLEKFKGLLNWNILSDSSVECLFTQTNLERFEKYWNWSILSENRSVKFTPKLIDRFVDNWDWKKLIDIHRGLENLYTEYFQYRKEANDSIHTLNKQILTLESQSVWDKFQKQIGGVVIAVLFIIIIVFCVKKWLK